MSGACGVSLVGVAHFDGVRTRGADDLRDQYSRHIYSGAQSWAEKSCDRGRVGEDFLKCITASGITSG